MRKLLTVLFLVASAVNAQAPSPPAAADYTPGPDSQPQSGTPKGTVTTLTSFLPARFYPGTPHNYRFTFPPSTTPRNRRPS